MFHRVTIKNFKSLADVSTSLGQFNVFVGDNGAGKTSFLQALDLASWSIRYESINAALRERGIEFTDLVYLRAARAKIEVSTQLSIPSDETEEERVLYGIRLAKRRYAYIDLEVSTRLDVDPANSPFCIVGLKRQRLARDVTGEEIRHSSVALGRSILHDVYFARSGESRFPNLYEVARHFINYAHYEIWGPEKLREPSQRNGSLNGTGFDGLGSGGENLPVLLNRIRRSSDKSGWNGLMKELARLYPHIDEIRFKRGLEPGVLGLEFGEQPKAAGRRLWFRPSQMSDGFMRILALLAIKHQPEPLSLLGYEEPENGLHPSALEGCMKHLKQIARRGTQVIVTTHSPYLLNHILEDQSEPRAELRLVLKGSDGRTQIVEPDQDKISLARKQGFGVGELWGMLLNETALT